MNLLVTHENIAPIYFVAYVTLILNCIRETREEGNKFSFFFLRGKRTLLHKVWKVRDKSAVTTLRLNSPRRVKVCQIV